MSSLKLKPQKEVISGSSLSGTDNTKNRTYALANTTASSTDMKVWSSSVMLHEGASRDWTFSYSTGKVTFLNNMRDSDTITFSYYQELTEPTFVIESATAYCTTLQVFEYLNAVLEIPNYPDSSTPETVDTSGTLAASSVIYLDQAKIIDNTLTLYHGTSATGTLTELTEDTHYTINLSRGQITITAAGASEISTDSVYAVYKYNNLFSDSFISDLIDRSTREINDRTNKTWGDLTLVIREEQTGRGSYARLYRPNNKPVYIVKTQLEGAITTASTTLIVDSTNGWEEDDYLTVDDEVLKIESVDGITTATVSRAQFGTTTASHTDDTFIINFVNEISNTNLGNTPTWYVSGFRDDFDVDSDTGAVQLLHVNAEDKDDLSSDVYPLHKVFNRVRFTYKYGTASVPDDIKDLCVMMVSYKLMSSAIAKSLPSGIDGFSPTAQQEIKADIDKKIGEHKVLRIDGF